MPAGDDDTGRSWAKGLVLKVVVAKRIVIPVLRARARDGAQCQLWVLRGRPGLSEPLGELSPSPYGSTRAPVCTNRVVQGSSGP